MTTLNTIKPSLKMVPVTVTQASLADNARSAIDRWLAATAAEPRYGSHTEAEVHRSFEVKAHAERDVVDAILSICPEAPGAPTFSAVEYNGAVYSVLPDGYYVNEASGTKDTLPGTWVLISPGVVKI
jgi:hypothetical protein